MWIGNCIWAGTIHMLHSWNQIKKTKLKKKYPLERLKHVGQMVLLCLHHPPSILYLSWPTHIDETKLLELSQKIKINNFANMQVDPVLALKQLQKKGLAKELRKVSFEKRMQVLWQMKGNEGNKLKINMFWKAKMQLWQMGWPCVTLFTLTTKQLNSVKTRTLLTPPMSNSSN